MRITISSTNLPIYPAIIPRTAPTAMETPTTMTAMNASLGIAYKILERMSSPDELVPRR